MKLSKEEEHIITPFIDWLVDNELVNNDLYKHMDEYLNEIQRNKETVNDVNKTHIVEYIDSIINNTNYTYLIDWCEDNLEDSTVTFAADKHEDKHICTIECILDLMAVCDGRYTLLSTLELRI